MDRNIYNSNKTISLTKENTTRSTKIFILLFVFIVFSYIALMQLGDTMLLEIFDIQGKDSFISFGEGRNASIFKFIFKIAMFSLPIIFILSLELTYSPIKYFKQLAQTSLGRISQSEGYKYADIWYFFFGIFRAKLTTITVILTLGTSHFSDALSSWFHGLYKSIIPISNSVFIGTLVIVFAILIGELGEYIDHYMTHRIPFLWDLHEFHHSATQMTMLSNSRGNVLQEVIMAPVMLPFSVFSGLVINEYLGQRFMTPLFIYMIFATMKLIFGVIGHSSLLILYPKPISYIFMSPSLHWIHHSDNPDHYDRNIGGCFTLWDRVFGTYLDESHLQNIESFGVKNTQYNRYHPLYSYSILPILKIIRRVKKVLI